MRKPISKNGVRRALERVHAEGHITFTVPIGTVVDRLWHEMEKDNFGSRRKPVDRESVRTALPLETELDGAH